MKPSRIREKYITTHPCKPHRVKNHHWGMFQRHVYEGWSMKEIGNRYGISPGRVREILIQVENKIDHIQKWGYPAREERHA